MTTAISEDHILGAIATIKADLAGRLRCQSQIASCGCCFGSLPQGVTLGDCGVGVRYGVCTSLCVLENGDHREYRLDKVGRVFRKKYTEFSGAYTGSSEVVL